MKLFLTGLTGFLVVLIFTLLLLLRTNLTRTEEAVDRSRQLIADVAADAVNRSGAMDASSLEAQLAFLRGRFDVAGLELERRDGQRIRAGSQQGNVDVVTRLTGAGTLRLRFDSSGLADTRRNFLLTAGITIAAASLGAVLLLLYVPRITRPIEEMLGDARELGAQGDQEETSYLIETFRRSIATLKSQEAELKVLHDREKTRADDLERVTAALTRSLTSGLIAIDPAGNLVDVNGAGREILRIDAAEPAAGRSIDEVIPLPRFAETLRRAVTDEASLTRIEIDDVRPGGEPATIGLSTVPLRNEAGTFLGFLALFTDLTPIRELETRVQEMTTFAQLGEISAGIAHEFRSSLSTILGYMKLARRGAIDAVAEARLQSAEKEASALLQAIERLLAFARPIHLNAERVDLREIVSEQVGQLAEIAPDVKVTIEGPPVAIDGDRVLLSRALENLLRNAVDAVRQKEGGGSVRVTFATEPAPSVSIADDGVGFDPADTARLFLPFQSNKPNGFGMGLPLAKKIVLMHGGTLRLQGAAGQGAVATIEFAPQAASVPAA